MIRVTDSWLVVAVAAMENTSDRSSSPLSADEQSLDDKSIVTLRFITSSKVQFDGHKLPMCDFFFMSWSAIFVCIVCIFTRFHWNIFRSG